MDETPRNPKQNFKIAIVGGGISGLACAYYINKLAHANNINVEIALFEKKLESGGAIRSRKLNNLCFEEGPDSIITNKPEALNLARELGLENKVLQTNAKYRRAFVVFNRKLHPLPDGFAMIAPSKLWPFLCSSLFTISEKLRILLEVFIPPSGNTNDESVSSFVLRRFGKQALVKIAQPMLAGIYTADPDNLSLKATMPRFLNLENQYGSVIKGLVAESKASQSKAESGARYSLFVGLKDGLYELVQELIKQNEALQLHSNSKVEKIINSSPNYQLELEDVLNAKRNLSNEQYTAVVIACPAFASSKIIEEIDLDLANKLMNIEYSSCAIVILSYYRKQIKHKLDGFGFVVPESENLNTLACTFVSIKFADRCPQDQVLLRVFLGGIKRKDILNNSDQTLIDISKSELDQLLDIDGEEIHSQVNRHPDSMPQYKVGHLGFVEDLERHIKQYPGLFLCGAAYRGVGIPDCIAQGKDTAGKVIEYLLAN